MMALIVNNRILKCILKWTRSKWRDQSIGVVFLSSSVERQTAVFLDKLQVMDGQLPRPTYKELSSLSVIKVCIFDYSI